MSRVYRIAYNRNNLLMVKEVSSEEFKHLDTEDDMLNNCSMKIANGVIELSGLLHKSEELSNNVSYTHYNDYNPLPYNEKHDAKYFIRDKDFTTVISETGLWPFKQRENIKALKVKHYRLKEYTKKTIISSYFHFEMDRLPVQAI